MWNEDNTCLETFGGQFWRTCGERNGEKDWETSAACPSALSTAIDDHSKLPLRWPDVGFVCPVSVSCVFLRGCSEKRLCVKTFFCVCVCIRAVQEAQIYLYRYFLFFSVRFFQSCVWWTRSTSSFVNQQICLCIFQCFWDKNMLHIVSSILACVRTVIWYNTLYSYFGFLGIFRRIPFLSATAASTLATSPQLSLSQKKTSASTSQMRNLDKDLISEVVLTFFKAYTQLWWRNVDFNGHNKTAHSVIFTVSDVHLHTAARWAEIPNISLLSWMSSEPFFSRSYTDCHFFPFSLCRINKNHQSKVHQAELGGKYWSRRGFCTHLEHGNV